MTFWCMKKKKKNQIHISVIFFFCGISILTKKINYNQMDTLWYIIHSAKTDRIDLCVCLCVCIFSSKYSCVLLKLHFYLMTNFFLSIYFWYITKFLSFLLNNVQKKQIKSKRNSEEMKVKRIDGEKKKIMILNLMYFANLFSLSLFFFFNLLYKNLLNIYIFKMKIAF